MIKIFFVTFFIAELIIALSVIMKIWQFDRCVNGLSDMVLSNQNKIRSGFIDLRLTIEEFEKALVEIQNYIAKKREEYLLGILKTSLMYSCIFMLKGKYKKSVFAFQLVKEIYEGFKEADI